MRKDPLQPIHDWYSRRKQRRGARLLSLTDPAALERFMRWSDHGIFREAWQNIDQIAPGVWRSNHPPARRLKAYADRGIRTILNLRGAENSVPWKWEEKQCAELGLTLLSARLDARRAPDPQAIREVLHHLRTAERPLLFHCKSGADRAGLVAALYLLVIEGRPLDDARRMLSPRYLHFRRSRTGVLDLFLETYGRAQAETGIGFEDWLDRHYDPATLQAAFDAR